MHERWTSFVAVLFLLQGSFVPRARAGDVTALEPAAASQQVDELIAKALAARPGEAPPALDDAGFLRRASLDITGRLPGPEELALFVLDPEPEKRARRVRSLLASEGYAKRWARYWRDAIYYRAQDPRAEAQAGVLEVWLEEQFAAGRGWDEIATALITASGPIAEEGSTGLIFAQNAQAPELASETARLFLGLQIQCAQCHDHPYDEWKREQFHELAAFFPRVRLRRDAGAGERRFEVASENPARPRGPAPDSEAPAELFARLDADGDGSVRREEVPRRLQAQFNRLLRLADRDGDGVLTLEEVQNARPPRPERPTRGEHYMPDLEHPERRGTLMQPVFFITGESPGEHASDLERRRALAEYFRSPENPWFARALVNRIWAEMTGWGFVEPVDDLGPGRRTELPEILDLLACGLRQSGFQLRWLIETIASTELYQREALPRNPAGRRARPDSVCPSRLNADQLFDSLAKALGMDGAESAEGRGGVLRGLRAQFGRLFGYDPSTPPAEVAGTVPQARFLMNSRAVIAAIAARGRTVLARLLAEEEDDDAMALELYLLVLAREPSVKEKTICRGHIEAVGDRNEAFEDIYWSLLNSTELLMKR